MPRRQPVEPEPYFELSIPLPREYVFTARARPSTVRRTVLRLLPWAIFAAMPRGRLSRVTFGLASRVSPLAQQR
jgi:hypothetical protein